MGISDEQGKHREFLKEIMMKNGFLPLNEEWWHFTLKNEPYPDIYFDFSVDFDATQRLFAIKEKN